MKNFKKLIAVIALVALFLTTMCSAVLAEVEEGGSVTIEENKKEDKEEKKEEKEAEKEEKKEEAEELEEEGGKEEKKEEAEELEEEGGKEEKKEEAEAEELEEEEEEEEEEEKNEEELEEEEEEVEAETLTPAKFDWQKYWADRRAAAMKAAWENNPWVKEWLAEKAAYEERAAKEAAAAEAAKKAEEEAAKLEQWKKMTWWVTDSIELTEGQSWLRVDATKTSQYIEVIPQGTKLIYHPSENKVDEKGQVWVKVIYNGQVGWVSTKYTNKSVVIEPAKPAPVEKQGVYAETGSTVLRETPNKDTGKFVDILSKGKSATYLGKFWFDERGQIWYKVKLGDRIGWVSGMYTKLYI